MEPKPSFSLFVMAGAETGAMSKDGVPLWDFPQAREWLKELAGTRVVIMNHNVWNYFPDEWPYPSRIVVVSEDRSPVCQGAAVEKNFNDALTTAYHLKPSSILIVGTPDLYSAGIVFAGMLHLVRVIDDSEGDRFLMEDYEKEFNYCPMWHEDLEHGNVRFSFCTLQKTQKPA